MRAWLPGALTALLALWAGTFQGAATAAGAAVAYAGLLAMVPLASDAWKDPLGLGYRWGRLPWGLYLLVVLSCALSPVRRAGWVVLLLVPAFLLLPAAVARCWQTAAARRTGIRVLAGVVCAVAVVSLAWQWRLGTPQAALPLGHHNLLAAWLLTLGPLAVVPLVAASGSGGKELLGRVLGLASAALIAAAVVGTGSTLGLAVLLAQIVAAAFLAAGFSVGAHRRLQGAVGAPLSVGAGLAALLGLAILAAAAVTGRFSALLAGQETALKARLGYWRAGFDGLLERPLLGWGPGSTPWTAALHWRPRPGREEPGEVLADLHSGPLRLAYELGLPAVLVALVLIALFLAARRRALGRAPSEAAAAGEPHRQWMAFAGFAGAGGFVAMSLANGLLVAPALPAAFAVALGLLLAVAPQAPPEPASREFPEELSRGRQRTASYLLVAILALAPILVAQFCYQAARGTADETLVLDRLQWARTLDPAFPLYQFRTVLESPPGVKEAARRARSAALRAPGVAALWLEAGLRGAEVGEPWAEETLIRSCRLAPLSAPASMALARNAETPSQVAFHGARALMSEPRLAAALSWRGDLQSLELAALRIEVEEGLDRGWRAALMAALPSVVQALEGTPAEAGSATAALALDLDGGLSRSLSLHLFRRQPWPAALAPVTVSLAADGRIALPSAARLPSTHPEVFSPETCAPRKP